MAKLDPVPPRPLERQQIRVVDVDGVAPAAKVTAPAAPAPLSNIQCYIIHISTGGGES